MLISAVFFGSLRLTRFVLVLDLDLLTSTRTTIYVASVRSYGSNLTLPSLSLHYRYIHSQTVQDILCIYLSLSVLQPVSHAAAYSHGYSCKFLCLQQLV